MKGATLLLIPNSVPFDSLSNSDADISILLPDPLSNSEKATASGVISSFPNERNLNTEIQKRRCIQSVVSANSFGLQVILLQTVL